MDEEKAETSLDAEIAAMIAAIDVINQIISDVWLIEAQIERLKV
jgi:hypothetical protein